MIAFALGDRVRLAVAIDVYPFALIREGETGTVALVEVDPEGPTFWVMLDRTHPGLGEWGNCLILDSDLDWSGGDVEVHDSPTPPEHTIAVIRSKLELGYPLGATCMPAEFGRGGS